MSMYDKMKEKAIPATSVKLSKEVVKTVSKADIVSINYSMKPIMEQNKREYIAGLEYLNKNSTYYGDKIYENDRKILTKKRLSFVLML